MLIFGSILSIISGLIFGSFLSVIIPRIYHERPGIFLGRSHCPHCKHTLAVFDLIPLISYIVLGGKCRYCQKEISKIYPAIEIVTALTFLTLFATTANTLLNQYKNNWALITFILLGIHLFVLIFTFFYDLLYLEISDTILIPAILIALIQTFIPNSHLFPETKDALLGAAIPLCIFLIQILLSKGRWLGLGDLRIGAYMGLLLGLEKTVLALIITYTVGGLVSAILLITKKADRKSAIPFGPFLVMGTIVALFIGDSLLDFYFNTLLLMM